MLAIKFTIKLFILLLSCIICIYLIIISLTFNVYYIHIKNYYVRYTNMILKYITIIIISCNVCECFFKPSILKLNCNDYLNSLNTISKINDNFKDKLKLQNGKETMSYNELVHQNQCKNLKDILISNNKNIINIKLNDDKVYKYYHSRKIDIIGLINLIYYYYN